MFSSSSSRRRNQTPRPAVKCPPRSAAEDIKHLNSISELAERAFEELDPAFRDFLEYYRFTEDNWAGLSALDLSSGNDIDRLPTALQAKFCECIRRINALNIYEELTKDQPEFSLNEDLLDPHPAGPPFIFPEGVGAWDQLFRVLDPDDDAFDAQRPLAGWPWPYSASEVERVESLFPAEMRVLVAKVVWAARLFLHSKSTNKKLGLKPNPQKELMHLRAAARAFMEAVDQTSDVARKLARLDDLDLMRVKLTVDRLQHGLPRLDATSGGRPKELEEQEFIWSLQQIFQTIFSISSSPCKWEDFVVACTDPLVSFRLRDGSGAMSKVGPAAWRSRLAEAKKRHDAMKNRP